MHTTLSPEAATLIESAIIDQCSTCAPPDPPPEQPQENTAPCRYHLAAPHPQYPDEIRFLIRFVRPPKAVPCAVCQRKTKKLWTMLCPFVAHVQAGMTFRPTNELAPLTRVCEDHPLFVAPAIHDAVFG